MQKKRLKTKSITMYIDPKYTLKVEYLKYTTSLTRFVENALDKLVMDPALLESVKKIIDIKEGLNKEVDHDK